MLAGLCVPAKVRCGARTFSTHMSLSNDPDFLDGSGDMFQTGSWHLGHGTICYGQTYGFKVLRFRWVFEVMHGRPEDDPS